MTFTNLLKKRMAAHKYLAITLFSFSLIFSVITLSAIVLYSACGYAEQNAGKQVGGSIRVKSCEEDDLQRLDAEGQKISYDWVQEFGRDKMVKDYETQSMAGVHGKNVSHMSLMDDFLDREDEKGNLLLVYEKNMMEHYTFHDFGDSITEGRGLEVGEAGNKAVVSKTFAQDNALSVGATIELKSLSGDALNLEVVGISSREYHGDFIIPVRAAEYNYIFTTKEIVDKANHSSGVYKVEFKLADCKDADVILHKLQKETRGRGYLIETDLTGYHNILAGLMNTQTTVTILLAAAVTMGAFIISLFSVYSLTGRLNEIGILISIGFKKGFIIAQYVLELFIPVILGNLICLVLFIAARKPLSAYITDKIRIIPDMQVSLNAQVLTGYFACVLLIVLFSSIYVLYIVAKYKPKELLAKYS